MSDKIESVEKEKPGKSRSAETTKKNILGCAKASFSMNSYDAVGLREIASAAKIDPALIIRYFGSKEGLFREVLEQDLVTKNLSQIDSDQFMDQMISWTLDPNLNAEAHGTLLVLLRSVTSEVAAPIIRECLQTRVIGPLNEKIGGKTSEEGCEMALAILMGLATYCHVLKLPRLSDGNYRHRIEVITPILSKLIHRSTT